MTKRRSRRSAIGSGRVGAVGSGGGAPAFRALGADEPSIVLIPGGPGMDPTSFLPWLEPLAARCRLILPDLSGSGWSPFAGPDEAIGLAAWVAEVEALRSRLGLESVCLLGYSAGSFVAQEYALRYPAATVGLIVLNGAPMLALGPADLERIQAALDGPGMEAFQKITGPEPLDEPAFKAAVCEVLRCHLHRRDPQTVDGALASVRFHPRGFRLGMASAAGFDIRARLAELRMPLLVLAGEEDWLWPPEVSLAPYEAVPGAELHRLAAAGHWCYVDRPAEVGSIILAWLERYFPRQGSVTH